MESNGIRFIDTEYIKADEWLTSNHDIPLDIKNVLTTSLERQTAKRVCGKNGEFTIDDYKGIRDTRYKCPCCSKYVKNDDIYCHRCGQKIIFPKIKFSDYVEGQRQERWIEWESWEITDGKEEKA